MAAGHNANSYNAKPWKDQSKSKKSYSANSSFSGGGDGFQRYLDYAEQAGQAWLFRNKLLNESEQKEEI